MRRRSLDPPPPGGRIAPGPAAAARPALGNLEGQPYDHSWSRWERFPARLLAVALIAVALLFAGGGPAHAVANGSAVPDGKYAFAVKLIDIGIPTASGGRRDSSCSGALIAPHWVLTAGHCFRDAQDHRVSHPVADKSTAVVGRTDLTGHDGHEATVVAVRQQGTADISLARLDRAITDITPLRVGRSRPRTGQPARLTGYGLTTATATTLPTHLLTGGFTVSSVTDLEIGMTGTTPRADTSPCPHDSGGPYFTEAADGTATVVGVVSHGPDCPHTGPDMAARVDAVAPWILSVIGADLATSPAPSARHSPAAPHSPAAQLSPAARHSPGSAASPPPAAASPPAPARHWLLASAGAGTGALALALLWRSANRHRGAHRRRPAPPP